MHMSLMDHTSMCLPGVGGLRAYDLRGTRTVLTGFNSGVHTFSFFASDVVTSDVVTCDAFSSTLDDIVPVSSSKPVATLMPVDMHESSTPFQSTFSNSSFYKIY